MGDAPAEPTLRTDAGELPLHEYRLAAAGRTWSVLHTGAILSHDDEQRFLGEPAERRAPYGVALWPASIALAHEVLARAAECPGRSVLELGAGTGLPGIVAATLGARVVQTDRHAAALEVCRGNGARNGATGVAYRLADWRAWDDGARYDWILGADILYATSVHAELRRVLETALAPGGSILLADPFRAPSLALLEAMERDGWRIALAKWRVGEELGEARPVGVYELRR